MRRVLARGIVQERNAVSDGLNHLGLRVAAKNVIFIGRVPVDLQISLILIRVLMSELTALFVRPPLIG